MNEGFTANLPAMQAGVDAINAVVSRLHREHESLHSQLGSLVAEWDGTGGDDWDALERRWNTSHREMLAVLRRIRAALQHAIEIDRHT